MSRGDLKIYKKNLLVSFFLKRVTLINPYGDRFKNFIRMVH